MSDIDSIDGNSLPKLQVQQKTIQLFGINIHALSMKEALANVHQAITNKQSLHVGMLNAAKVVNMKRNPALGEDVTSSNMILADGSAVVMASKLLGKKLPERVAGIDLMHGILAEGSQLGYRVFCLGATEEISHQIEIEIGKHYPGVVVAGRQNGYFSAEQEPSVAQRIADSKADVLFVAITSPKKEQFMAKWNATMKVPVVHGVGGSFDVFAGKVQRAPLMWQKLGMEWLYRVLQEPGRLWKRYLVTNTLFLGMLAKEMIKPTKS
ncbi:glycosyltransferase [Psychromonas sp. psych-6C06]|uniref:WecB/TagA/CpsF family glycosyltransferase n=1 Tax=Psychromonas sp. psych-6C06 TaxID=2058089 RepID=UPI000C34CE9B|nr:WecB/TagA/CpsF family glycosyltransferase [Psychromonas sp. psych-6C06]PKF61430.1 glycosyltransferase [Psychromonas sp. psych-6C06]